MVFVTQFDDVKFCIDSEKGSKENFFEFGSYRDTKTMVEEFVSSGKRLEASRAALYDEDMTDENFEVSPIREKNFDLVDGEHYLNEFNNKVETESAVIEKAKRTSKKAEKVETKPVENTED